MKNISFTLIDNKQLRELIVLLVSVEPGTIREQFIGIHSANKREETLFYIQSRLKDHSTRVIDFRLKGTLHRKSAPKWLYLHLIGNVSVLNMRIHFQIIPKLFRNHRKDKCDFEKENQYDKKENVLLYQEIQHLQRMVLMLLPLRKQNFGFQVVWSKLDWKKKRIALHAGEIETTWNRLQFYHTTIPYNLTSENMETSFCLCCKPAVGKI